MNPDEVVAVGAAIPILPWIIDAPARPVVLSIVLGALGALGLGGGIGAMTGRGSIRSALRFLTISAASAGVTYVVGAAIGAG